MTSSPEFSLHHPGFLSLYQQEILAFADSIEPLLAPNAAALSPATTEKLLAAARAARSASRIMDFNIAAAFFSQMENTFAMIFQGKMHRGEELEETFRLIRDFFSRCRQTSPESLVDLLKTEAPRLEQLATSLHSASATAGLPPALSSAPGQQARPSEVCAPPPAEIPPPDPVSVEVPEVFTETEIPDDPVLFELFKADMETQTRNLENGLVELEKRQSPDVFELLMRATHSIKGLARVLGLNSIGALAHTMEDLFTSGRNGQTVVGSEQIDSLLQANDFFQHLLTLPAADIPRWTLSQTEVVLSLKRTLEAPDGPCSRPGETSGATNQSPSSPAIAEARGQGPKPAPTASRVHSPASSQVSAADDARETFVRVKADKLNRLMGLAGECHVEAKSIKSIHSLLFRLKNAQKSLADSMDSGLFRLRENATAPEGFSRLQEAVADREKCGEYLAKLAEQVSHFSRRLENVTEKLNNEMVASRMRPFADGVQGFPRMIRDLAKALGKKLDFQVLGAPTPVDRDILEKLEAPLTHLLRNAIDHGLENPTERTLAGKPPVGRLSIEAAHRAGMLQIVVRDDGKGINTELLRTKIVERGYTTRETAAAMSNPELIEFLFLPGFSTAGQVTDVSGRGVGMDVVQSMVREVGGTIRTETALGRGTTFTLQLPLTLSVIRTLLVEVSGEIYALPLSRLDFLVRIPRRDLQTLEDRQFMTFKGEHIGLVSAHQVLQTEHPPVSSDQQLSVLVISDAMNTYGLVVDRFAGERELVIVALDPRLGKVPNISAGAFLEDGRPILLLDIEDLVRSIDNIVSQGNLRKVGEMGVISQKPRKRILIADDSLTVRELERRLLENRGYQVTIAVDGMDAWKTMQTDSFDLVVSDIDMPRMNGFELVGKIKNDGRFRDLPVIIVSYKDREEDRLKGLEAGASYYLTKSSFHDERLVSAVLDLIGEA